MRTVLQEHQVHPANATAEGLMIRQSDGSTIGRRHFNVGMDQFYPAELESQISVNYGRRPSLHKTLDHFRNFGELAPNLTMPVWALERDDKLSLNSNGLPNLLTNSTRIPSPSSGNVGHGMIPAASKEGPSRDAMPEHKNAAASWRRLGSVPTPLPVHRNASDGKNVCATGMAQLASILHVPCTDRV